MCDRIHRLNIPRVMTGPARSRVPLLARPAVPCVHALKSPSAPSTHAPRPTRRVFLVPTDLVVLLVRPLRAEAVFTETTVGGCAAARQHILDFSPENSPFSPCRNLRFGEFPFEILLGSCERRM